MCRWECFVIGHSLECWARFVYLNNLYLITFLIVNLTWKFPLFRFLLHGSPAGFWVGSTATWPCGCPLLLGNHWPFLCTIMITTFWITASSRRGNFFGQEIVIRNKCHVPLELRRSECDVSAIDVHNAKDFSPKGDSDLVCNCYCRNVYIYMLFSSSLLFWYKFYKLKICKPLSPGDKFNQMQTMNKKWCK